MKIYALIHKFRAKYAIFYTYTKKVGENGHILYNVFTSESFYPEIDILLLCFFLTTAADIISTISDCV
jgi:hypothetical protein